MIGKLILMSLIECRECKFCKSGKTNLCGAGRSLSRLVIAGFILWLS